MPSALLFNRVKVATATTGTGTITLGAAFSNAFCTFAEGGVANGNVVTYTIEDGLDFEIGRGTYTSSGTTLSRDTVLLSKIGGTAGTSKINLSGSATVFLTAAKEDLDVNDFTEDTAPDRAADYAWVHDASATLKKKVLLKRTGGLVSRAYAEYTANADIAATIPYDDTIPQNTEGVEILTAQITPISTSNRVRVRFNGWGSNAPTSILTVALFQDSVANALAARGFPTTSSSGHVHFYLEFEHVPATLSAVTYKIRVGTDTGGTIRLNGTTSARRFGGASQATLVVEEIAP